MIFEKIGKEALLTDLYQLTMAAVYFLEKPDLTATFEMQFRRLPDNRSYLVSCGLEQVIDFVENLSFNRQEIDFLKSLEVFENIPDSFFEYLHDFKFSGDINAVPEGTIVFENEPVIQVSANIIEAQLLETWMLAAMNFQTLIASKAARIKMAAGDKKLAEFGLRRAHSPYAGIFASRASYIGGFDSTSNVYAGYLWGIPVSGTMAHSYIQSCENEEEAFQKYNKAFPKSSVMLIDTYNIEQGARKAAETDKNIIGVRIDSGDIVAESIKVRKILDDAGLKNARIFASGDLNEFSIEKENKVNAPIDAFGVGTDLVTSKDSPSISGIYKLVEIIDNGREIYKTKFSQNKMVYPGKKQLYREFDKNGICLGDLVTTADEQSPAENFKPLLKPLFRKGKLVVDRLPLTEIRNRAQENLKTLPDGVKRIENPDKYPVKHSEKLHSILKNLANQKNIKNI